MKKIDVEMFDPSLEPIEDKAHRIVRASLGALPLFSGTALEALNSLVEDPYNSGRTLWLHELSNAINELAIDMEKLKADTERNSLVLSTIIQSTDIALKTGDKSKHRLLINLVLKSIQSQEVDEELISIYLSTISQMTSSHLALLNLIANRQRYEHGWELEKHEGLLRGEISECDMISAVIPPERLLSDLLSMQLIYSPPGSPGSSSSTNYSTMELSEYAKGFVQYIREI